MKLRAFRRPLCVVNCVLMEAVFFGHYLLWGSKAVGAHIWDGQNGLLYTYTIARLKFGKNRFAFFYSFSFSKISLLPLRFLESSSKGFRTRLHFHFILYVYFHPFFSVFTFTFDYFFFRCLFFSIRICKSNKAFAIKYRSNKFSVDRERWWFHVQLNVNI